MVFNDSEPHERIRAAAGRGKWVDEIEDLTFKVDNLIKKIDCK